MKIAVLGGGAMGQVTVRDLAESKAVQEILVADLDLARAESFKSLSSKIQAAKADVSQPEALSAVLKGWDVVINCCPYVFNLKVMEAALSAGCHYLDLGGLFHTTRKQLELHERFQKADLLAVLGMGAAPGITNIMAACAADSLSTVESIDIYAASVDLAESTHPFMPPYALDTILDEYFLEPMAFEDGQFVAHPPLSGESVLEYPEPVGVASSFLTLHSEVATLPLVYKDKGVKRVTYRLGLPEEFHERCKFLVDLGFGGTEEIKVGEQKLKPRKILQAMIDLHTVSQSDPLDCEVIRVDVVGTRDGGKVSIRMETVVHSCPKWKISSGALDTGVPPSIVAQMIVSGVVTARGVQAPEQSVPALPFFNELARRGITMRQITDAVISQTPALASC